MAGPDDAHRRSALLPGERLGLALDERSDEFARLLLAPPLDGIHPAGRAWLRERYEEIVPVVLPAALRAVERGEPVAPECLDELRALAARSATDPAADLAVALRGALPALRVFTLVMRTAARDPDARTMLAMGRASVVAHELGSCWVEAWNHERRTVTADVAAVELEAVVPGVEETEQEMLTLAAKGLSNDEIARRTSYSRQAVAWHLGRLMRACGAPNRTALVSVAFLRGWLRSRRPRGDDEPWVVDPERRA
ncbi:helix-turn-helix transcriptional regulator [Curtobacterium sp. 22159]|uniref:helix-turn-helix transcriptional regulator n=1 Tax=Curtobacterium sp. 22159 TaxID=3453882 RepID=UPI003F84F9BB